MVTLHGKHLRAGFKFSENKIGQDFPTKKKFIPFPPFNSINIQLPAGLAQIFQIGIAPLVGLIQYNIPPTEITFQCILPADYPYYNQLFSLVQKDPNTYHYPPVDIRIGAVSIPPYSDLFPVLNLWGCLAKRLQISLRERYAVMTLVFAVPYGIYFPVNSAKYIPDPFIPQEPPVRWFDSVCRIFLGENEDTTAFGLARYTVLNAELEFNINMNLSLTLPNLEYAMGLRKRNPYEPMPVGGAHTPHEGSVTCSGTVRVALPPTGGIEFPPHIVGPTPFTIQIITPIGTFELRKAKINSFVPTLTTNAPLEFAINFQALGIFYFPP